MLAVLLAACTADAPNKDFTPVSTAGCPDLAGTFDVADTWLARAIAGRQAPPAHDLPVLLTFKEGPSNIEGWWVVPRERLVAFANDLAKDAPKRYGQWRARVLQKHPPGSAWDPDKTLADIVALGPPGPVYAQVVGRRCGGGWMMVASDTLRTPGKNDQVREEEREIWLARDAAGALLVRTDTY
ncbi:MAG TPA: hypothetical protein VJ724_08370, partial [Tahibacter sp.]|nr:hypothetical protein [Tahibacter sp.]